MHFFHWTPQLSNTFFESTYPERYTVYFFKIMRVVSGDISFKYMVSDSSETFELSTTGVSSNFSFAAVIDARKCASLLDIAEFLRWKVCRFTPSNRPTLKFPYCFPVVLKFCFSKLYAFRSTMPPDLRAYKVLAGEQVRLVSCSF